MPTEDGAPPSGLPPPEEVVGGTRGMMASPVPNDEAYGIEGYVTLGRPPLSVMRNDDGIVAGIDSFLPIATFLVGTRNDESDEDPAVVEMIFYLQQSVNLTIDHKRLAICLTRFRPECYRSHGNP